MPRAGKSAHKFDIRIAPAVAGEAGARRVMNRVLKRDRDALRAAADLKRQIHTLDKEHRRQLTQLIGPRGVRELNAIRSSGAKIRRSQKIRRSLALLKDYGVERSQLLDLTRPYLRKTRDLMAQSSEALPDNEPLAGPCNSPWVSHTAPFGGYSWWYNWSRTSNPRDPVLERYLETSTGRVGSRIETKDPDAGDNDELTADYYTGFSLWHTPQMTGPLDIYLAFEFNVSTYSGKVRDEFGFSDIIHNQYAVARMTATDSQDPNQKDDQESVIYGFTDFLWGEDDDWSREVARPRDLHWYYFKTAATFYQGSPVLIEAGVQHGTWFRTNDESITMAANIDLRLDQVRIRSCEAEIIL